MAKHVLMLLAAVVVGHCPWVVGADPQTPGYTDTPLIPGTEWHVHDSRRPHPEVVEPPSVDELEERSRPPEGAIILFDGTDLSAWVGPKGQPPTWKVENGYMEVVPKAGSIRTREEFGACLLHVEFATPPPKGGSQGRGNSGVFLMGRYEIQILDSYENVTYADGQCAAIYGQYPPLVNVCRPPGEWQSFDITFTPPVFDGEKLVSPARVTVYHNGVLVHEDRELLGPTSHKRAPRYRPHGPTGPISLQDHKNPMRFRNIWLVPLDRE